MAELHPLPLNRHWRAIAAEIKAHNSIYGYPLSKLFTAMPEQDFSVTFHGHRAFTPIGPAAGPHTQLIPNILLSFLGGSRIIELKTVQILDDLDIPRPCIDMRNIGFNVEWSQELKLRESYNEYVGAWVLLHMLRESELLPPSTDSGFFDTVFDMSVGYDLQGIQSEPMQQWIANMKNAAPAIEKLLETVPEYAGLNVPSCISDSITLSTFHGCPPAEIEGMVKHLIATHGVHVIVKMNPTLAGFDFVKDMLHNKLGYRHIELDRKAFDDDLQFSDAIPMLRRLKQFAADHGAHFGAKFTNTLVVKNNENIFSEKVQYLSGAPLHVISMNLMLKVREEMGPDFPVSFSAGIDKNNVVDALLCNMVPVTTCTDLLKKGGYARMPLYLKNLAAAMNGQQVTTVSDLIKKSGRADSPAEAGMNNARRIIPELQNSERYHFRKNTATPRKIGSKLALFDCITCNICLPVCPNAANYHVDIAPRKIAYNDLIVRDGKLTAHTAQVFETEQKQQIVNLADFCNDCGNCDTFCPEDGGPFNEKPRFFLSRESWLAENIRNGFWFESNNCLHARIDDRQYTLSRCENQFTFESCDLRIDLQQDGQPLADQSQTLAEGTTIALLPFFQLKILLEAVADNADTYFSAFVSAR